MPEARIAIGHGQMPEKELSAVMLAFAEGEYDVLVCTSIIESGLDIPNANTIIINRADQFGLAQLYQLRGRVGRSAVRAYAYLLVDKYKTLTEDARRRLEAIQEASELGAGFRIAMHDLEIRGAGELLGARQHGHIAAVGLRPLHPAAGAGRAGGAGAAPGRPEGSRFRDDEEAERQDQTPVVATSLEDPLAPTVSSISTCRRAFPESYVPEAAAAPAALPPPGRPDHARSRRRDRQEFADRFGPVPEEVENLLYVVRVKVLAVNVGVEAIGLEEGQVLIKCSCLETDGPRPAPGSAEGPGQSLRASPAAHSGWRCAKPTVGAATWSKRWI